MPKAIEPQYEPKTDDQKLGYLVEECGEVMAATGKTLRWGIDSVNPELPPHEQVTNRNWLLDELHDLKRAIEYVEKALETKDLEGDYFVVRDDERGYWLARGHGYCEREVDGHRFKRGTPAGDEAASSAELVPGLCAIDVNQPEGIGG